MVLMSLFAGQQWRRLEKAMAPHSSTLAWKIPWMEEPCRLQFMGSLRVGHDRATSLFSLFMSMHWSRKWQPTPVFLPGESQGPRSQSRTRLKRLSSSSSQLPSQTPSPTSAQSSHCPPLFCQKIRDLFSGKGKPAGL